jgi:peptide/nickel transport system substrate-binding protein
MNVRRFVRTFLGICGLLCLVVVTSGCAASSSLAPGSLTIAIDQEPTGVDPCNYENAAAVPLKYNVVQALTNLDGHSNAVDPLLATSWDQTSPTTWLFHLRPHVTYQDGTPFTAAAAAYGINRSLNNQKVSCSDTAKISAGVKVTPSAAGPLTLRISTGIPDPILPRELSYVDLVSPKTPMDQPTSHPIGTGPYTWVTWKRGSYYEIKRWQGFWGTPGEFTGVRVVFRNEDSVRADMVATGEADIALPVLPQDLTSDSNARMFPIESTVFYRLPLQSAPFNDRRVREAMQYALNKKLIVSALLQQTGQPIDQIVTDAVNGYDPHYKAPPYDPAKARQLLAQAKAAGVPVDRTIRLVGQTEQFQNSDEVLQAVFNDLHAVGFHVQLQQVDAAQWKQLLFKPFPKNQVPTVLQTLHKNVSGDASSSFTSYIADSGCCGTAHSKSLDTLISRAGQASGAKRTQLYRQAADEEYTQDISMVPLASMSDLVLVGRRVTFTPDRLTASYEMNLSEVHLVHGSRPSDGKQ